MKYYINENNILSIINNCGQTIHVQDQHGDYYTYDYEEDDCISIFMFNKTFSNTFY